MTSRGISVVIPAYNSEATISDCLQSLKRQTLLPLEVIVVDDDSTDRTLKLAKEEAVVIPNSRSKGPAGARNTGARAAKGDIIAFTDSDCIVPEDWLKNIAAAFTDPVVAAVGGGYSSGVGNSFWQVFSLEELSFRRKNREGKVKTLVSNNFACKRSIFLEEGGFPEKYPVCEDMLISYKISQRGIVLWLNDNGVQHHFKDSLKAYLRHQYFFGMESTRFFCENPKVLIASDHHQGKTLHLAIVVAFLSIFSALMGILTFMGGNAFLGGIFLGIVFLLLLTHFLLYSRFLRYLARIRIPNVPKAYGVSFLRDVVCGFSFGEGIIRAFTNRERKSQA